MIVPVAQIWQQPGVAVIDVADFDSLLKIAAHYERSILHEHTEYGDAFWVTDESGQFRYAIWASAAAPETRLQTAKSSSMESWQRTSGLSGRPTRSSSARRHRRRSRPRATRPLPIRRGVRSGRLPYRPRASPLAAPAPEPTGSTPSVRAVADFATERWSGSVPSRRSPRFELTPIQ